MTRALAAGLLLAGLAASPALAQSAFTRDQLAALSFRQHPGALLPRDALLVDEEGRRVRLGDFFAGKPVILVLDYLRCRTLCGFVLSGLARSLAKVPLEAGRDFSVVALSIDPRDTPADARAARTQYLARYGRPGSGGWHFLAGDAATVRAIADTVGFPYRYDGAAGQYAHPAGFTVAAPDATISRYVLGFDYTPLDLRLALTEAARGRISSPVADLLLLCYCYDPVSGRYDLAIGNAMRIAGTLTVLALIGMIAYLARSRTTSLSPRGGGRGPALCAGWGWGPRPRRRNSGPLTLPPLRGGPLPLPQGERECSGR
jgi:protein SCO1/2